VPKVKRFASPTKLSIKLFNFLYERGKLFQTIFPLEAFHPAFRIQILLLSGEEWMAFRADSNPHILSGRSGLNNRPASAGNSGLTVFRMYTFFHCFYTLFIDLLIFSRTYSDN
jgi:hypothetical protein